MASLELVGRAVVLADGALGGLDQRLGQFVPDEVPAIVAQLGDTARGCAGEGMCGRVFGEQAGGELAVEGPDVAGEFRKAEIDHAVQLADAVVEILAQPVAVADQLAQSLGDLVVQVGGGRALLEGQAGEAGGIDGVGLGAFEAGLLEAAGDQRVEERHVMAGRGEHGEEVFPVMAGRLHDDEDGWRPERAEQGVVALAVLGDGDGLADRGACVVETGEDVALGRDIDPCEHDPSCCNRQRLEASAPAFMPILVEARTRAGKAVPQDPVRAWNAGRGHQSHARGMTPKRAAATLSQLPTRNLSQEARR